DGKQRGEPGPKHGETVMRKGFLGGVIVLFLFFVTCLACMGQGVPAEFLFGLIGGWAFFLKRVILQVTVNWGGMLTAVVCLVALVVGLQLFLGWVTRELRRRGAGGKEQQPGPWQMRWTLAIVALVVLMFVAGISAVGITHQTVWLMTSKEPITRSSSDVVSRILSSNNLKEIALALHTFHDNHGRFPTGALFDDQGTALHGWQTQLLPYIEQQELYGLINLRLPWNHPNNLPQFRKPIRRYQVPGADTQDVAGLAVSHYAANARVFGREQPVTLSELVAGRGTAMTIVAGEAAGNYKPWG